LEEIRVKGVKGSFTQGAVYTFVFGWEEKRLESLLDLS